MIMSVVILNKPFELPTEDAFSSTPLKQAPRVENRPYVMDFRFIMPEIVPSLIILLFLTLIDWVYKVI